MPKMNLYKIDHLFSPRMTNFTVRRDADGTSAFGPTQITSLATALGGANGKVRDIAKTAASAGSRSLRGLQQARDLVLHQQLATL
jgi:hypothetical protein